MFKRNPAAGLINVSVILRRFSYDRITSAVEGGRQALLKASGALRKARVPYAVIGGNAVALWVSRADEAAVRNTHNIDLLIRREDFDIAGAVLRGYSQK